MIIIPKKYKAYRQRKGTLKHNAAEAGVSMRTVQNWETNGISENEIKRAMYITQLALDIVIK